jgi:ATP-dependent Clp protease protease subunit
MQAAATEAAPSAATLDDQLTNRLLYQRIIVLGTEVDDKVANRLCAQLLLLSAEDPRADISLYINSPGGSVSAGQFLLCTGAAGKRFALPHAQVLMHQGSAGFGGTAADVEIYARQLERTGQLMTRLIAEHTGQPEETIRHDSQRDRWFSAAEARDYGFIDHIVDRVDDVRPAVSGQRAGL